MIACRIARIEDETIREMLLRNVLEDPSAGKVITMNTNVRKAKRSLTGKGLKSFN